MGNGGHEDEPEVDAKLEKNGADYVLGAETDPRRDDRHGERQDRKQDHQIEVHQRVLNIPKEKHS